MQVTVVAIGQRMPDWVARGFEEYRRRLSGQVTMELIEVAATRRGKNPDLKKIAEEEGRRLLSQIPVNALPIALEREGRTVDTLQLATLLQSFIDDAQDIAIMIGGPEGLSSECLRAARHVLTLSKLTFAHPLVRIILAEQIYRAHSINNGHPYHR